jgi:hypothetical protein
MRAIEVVNNRLDLEALGREAEACGTFRAARDIYGEKPTVRPVTDPRLTRLPDAPA